MENTGKKNQVLFSSIRGNAVTRELKLPAVLLQKQDSKAIMVFARLTLQEIEVHIGT